MVNYLTRPGGTEVSGQMPLQVDNVTQANDRTSVAAEAVTFNSAGAAGSTGINALATGPILNLTGDKIGSYWGEVQNKMMEFVNSGDNTIGTLTETPTAAKVVITDNTNVLDKLFETTSGSRRYILKAIDASMNVLYGWIGDITVSGVNYTFPIHNAVTSGAQTWIGSTTNFDETKVKRIEIYSYQSSLVWVTGTVLTEEVEFREELLERENGIKIYFDKLTNGQYGVNYRTNTVYFKKATTGTADTVNYSRFGSNDSTKNVTTSTVTSVNDSASSQVLLAANPARLSAYFYNTSTVAAYLNEGATATTSPGGFVTKIGAGGSVSADDGYKGIYSAIWDSDQAGAMSITERT